MDKELPVYDLMISDDPLAEEEVDFIALVDKPAIERNFLAFNENEVFVEPGPTETEAEFIGRCIGVLVGDEGYDQSQAAAVCYSKWVNRDKMKAAFAIQDEEQRIISGPLIVADRRIYRRDDKGEYYVVFPRETVKAIAIKYFKKGYQGNVNLMHDSGQVVGGVTMFESWIKDSERGIPGMEGFEDLPDGTWFGSFKVDNEDVWARIKSGEVKGFSVEGIFNYERSASTKEDALLSAIIRILDKVK
jgi:hypothetical protein